MYNNTLVEEFPVKIASFNGIEIFKIKSNKFKTNSINIYFYDNLNKENVTKNALIPAVLKRGTQKYPTQIDISTHLDELYGASFSLGVNKKGDIQIISFQIEIISDIYIEDKASLFKEATDFLFEAILNPVVQNNAFLDDYVSQEKINLKNLIEGRKNDKVKYSYEKCLEEMCKDEPYGIFEMGYVEHLNSINSNNLFEHYQHMLKSFPMVIFVTGDIPDQDINFLVEKLKKLSRDIIQQIHSTPHVVIPNNINTVVEKSDISQGKLSLGFRTNIAPGSQDYYKFLVYNGILGGGSHSKLFQVIREKEHLAYYIFSRFDKFKSLMFICSGIETSNKDRTIELILQQISDINNGLISDDEYQSTLKNFETGIKSIKDSKMQIVDFYLGQYISNNNDNLDNVLNNVMKVTKNDIISISNNVKLDTIFFLTSNPEGDL